jgi:hypothetical protein
MISGPANLMIFYQQFEKGVSGARTLGLGAQIEFAEWPPMVTTDLFMKRYRRRRIQNNSNDHPKAE